MTRNRAVMLCAVVMMMSAVLVVNGTAPAVAQEPTEGVVTSKQPQPQGGEANVGSGFTYQGYLEDGEQPANGVYDFRFLLYEADTGGSSIDDTSAADVSVSDGRFTTPLFFTAGAFTGTELWLEVRVRPGSNTGTYTALSPRQLVQPSPYANTLRPGAAIAASYGSTLFTVDNDNNRGMYVEAGDDGIQITAGSPDFFGYALGAGTGVEVNAENNGVFVGRANQYGVWVNYSGNHGVRVSHTDADGVRVEDAAEYGVRAVSKYDSGTSSNSSAAGVYGERTGTSGGYGGHFVHDGAYGQAVYGQATNQDGSDSEAVVGAVASAGGESFEAWHAGSGNNNYFVGCRSTDPDNLACNSVTYQIDVDGTTSSNSAFVGGGADYADMLEVAGDEAAYAPGDVFVVDTDGRLVRSNEPFQQAVIGVYSTQPAVIGDPRTIHQRQGLVDDESANNIDHERAAAEIEQFAASDGLVPVALVGVVPVKVSGENGAIVPGDLLVSSSVAGHAMNAGDDPPQGTVIGKAMQSFDGDTGVINMLVMLQ